MKKILVAFTIFVFSYQAWSQDTPFTEQDTLRGSITPERAWWDLNYYHLDIQVFPKTKFIKGKNTVRYTVLDTAKELQIDLQTPLLLTKAVQNGQELNIRHNGNAHFITLKEDQKIGTSKEITVYYEGNPRVAVNAPWDGGFSWKKDKNGTDFIATSCQGLGASAWWPAKDHMYDEVDSMDISVRIPDHLMNVSNGRLIGIDKHDDHTLTTHWQVKNPINNYGINVNIGDYVSFSEVYAGEKGPLDMNYYVLRDNLAKAKTQFKDATRMMEAFEHWFGPYPFYEDGYKLVEVPYLGMEHQSSVTYGNKYANGYLGRDLSGSGWGLKFDFIIIHESGHEWFANNITNKDIADMWIHESFTAYSENLFVDYYYGKEAASAYVIGTRKNILNDRPIIGPYNVNKSGSGDMYYKGANMLHTLRQLVDDDERWRQILRGLNKTFYHQTVTTEEIENFLSKEVGIDLQGFFDQYLRHVNIPVFEYSIQHKEMKYRWTNTVVNFAMPLKIMSEKSNWIYPSTQWQTMPINSDAIKINKDFYITVKMVDE